MIPVCTLAPILLSVRVSSKRGTIRSCDVFVVCGSVAGLSVWRERCTIRATHLRTDTLGGPKSFRCCPVMRSLTPQIANLLERRAFCLTRSSIHSRADYDMHNLRVARHQHS